MHVLPRQTGYARAIKAPDANNAALAPTTTTQKFTWQWYVHISAVIIVHKLN